MLSDERLAEIEAVAKKATPGPYRACTCKKCGLVWSLAADALVYDVAVETEADDVPSVSRGQRYSNKLFAGAVDPMTVLAMVAELREARRALADPMVRSMVDARFGSKHENTIDYSVPADQREGPHCVRAGVNQFLTPGGKPPPGWPEAG